MHFRVILSNQNDSSLYSLREKESLIHLANLFNLALVHALMTEEIMRNSNAQCILMRSSLQNAIIGTEAVICLYEEYFADISCNTLMSFIRFSALTQSRQIENRIQSPTAQHQHLSLLVF